jgi:putative toxin-antitoxin system antitoxin component (TIGR02293 family)
MAEAEIFMAQLVLRDAPPSTGTSSPVYSLANKFLGGRATLHRHIHDEVEAHSVISQGVPARAMVHLADDLHVLDTAQLLGIVGMSARNWQRRKEAARKDPAAALSVAEGSRLWKFAETLARATHTLGSQQAAETWLENPQRALDGKSPIDLLTTAPGAQLVEELLLRMEFGVYT